MFAAQGRHVGDAVAGPIVPAVQGKGRGKLLAQEALQARGLIGIKKRVSQDQARRFRRKAQEGRGQ
jgi:hypothetical protein